MMFLLLAIQVAGGDSLPLIYTPRLGPSTESVAPLLPASSTLPFPIDDTVRRRPRAIEYSNGYYTRLKIHKYASYATIPLFAAEYLTGDRLFKDAENGTRSSGIARSLHAPIAATIGGLFAVNTVTGVWNLWEGRKAPQGRARRIIHSLLMLGSDAGFLLTAAAAPEAGEGESGGRNRHRSLAIGSGSAALAGYLMMLIWN